MYITFGVSEQVVVRGRGWQLCCARSAESRVRCGAVHAASATARALHQALLPGRNVSFDSTLAF